MGRRIGYATWEHKACFGLSETLFFALRPWNPPSPSSTAAGSSRRFSADNPGRYASVSLPISLFPRIRSLLAVLLITCLQPNCWEKGGRLLMISIRFILMAELTCLEFCSWKKWSGTQMDVQLLKLGRCSLFYGSIFSELLGIIWSMLFVAIVEVYAKNTCSEGTKAFHSWSVSVFCMCWNALCNGFINLFFRTHVKYVFREPSEANDDVVSKELLLKIQKTTVHFTLICL